MEEYKWDQCRSFRMSKPMLKAIDLMARSARVSNGVVIRNAVCFFFETLISFDDSKLEPDLINTGQEILDMDDFNILIDHNKTTRTGRYPDFFYKNQERRVIRNWFGILERLAKEKAKTMGEL